MKRVFQYFAFCILLGASMIGCRNGIFDTEPLSDSHRDDKGNVILEDTPRMWQNFKDSVEPRIIKEISGEQPDSGKSTWNEYWMWRMQILPENRENRKKYVNYIVERRQQEGLPELTERHE